MNFIQQLREKEEKLRKWVKIVKQPSQPIKSKQKCEKPNPESELDRLARQWVELVFEQLQYEKYMKETEKTKCPVPVREKQSKI